MREPACRFSSRGVQGILPRGTWTVAPIVMQKPSFARLWQKRAFPVFLVVQAALAYTLDRSGRQRPEPGEQPNDGFWHPGTRYPPGTLQGPRLITLQNPLPLQA